MGSWQKGLVQGLKKAGQGYRRLALSLSHRQCYLCRQSSKDLICGYCEHFISPLTTHDNLLTNPDILKYLDTPQYDYLYAIGDYVWPFDFMVRDLKFNNKPVAGRALASLFYQRVFRLKIMAANNVCEALEKSDASVLPEILIPVPLSLRRYWQRGYNQSQVLADWLTTLTHIPNAPLLRRVRHTKAQANLQKQDRINNVDQAFECCLNGDYKHIAIIDDVLTTGATMNSAAQAVLEQNPHMTISVWCMAVTLVS